MELFWAASFFIDKYDSLADHPASIYPLALPLSYKQVRQY